MSEGVGCSCGADVIPGSTHASHCDSNDSATRIEFEAEITLTDDEIDGQGGLEQAVQNEIGHTGAVLVRVTRISESEATA